MPVQGEFYLVYLPGKSRDAKTLEYKPEKPTKKMRGRKRNLENRVFREQQQQKNKMFIPEFLSSQNMRSALRQ